MYNRNHRTSVVPTVDRHPQFFIRRSEIEFDERARFVEFVCNVWNEGRFGPDRPASVTVNWNDLPDSDPTAFYDRPDDWLYALMPCDVAPSLGRAADQKTETAFLKAKQMEFLTATAIGIDISADTSSNQGRGSP